MTVCQSLGVDMLWTPRTDIYPNGVENATGICLPASFSQPLCGQRRPHFFDGVCTVVYRLLMQLKPAFLVMGEKDFQQTVCKKNDKRPYDSDPICFCSDI